MPKRIYFPQVKKHEHVLGEVRKVKEGSGEVSALFLYETSRERAEEVEADPAFRIRGLVGACREIRCTICGEFVTWEEYPREAVRRLMRHYEIKKEDVV